MFLFFGDYGITAYNLTIFPSRPKVTIDHQ